MDGLFCIRTHVDNCPAVRDSNGRFSNDNQTLKKKEKVETHLILVAGRRWRNTSRYIYFIENKCQQNQTVHSVCFFSNSTKKSFLQKIHWCQKVDPKRGIHGWKKNANPSAGKWCFGLEPNEQTILNNTENTNGATMQVQLETFG